MPTVHPGQGEGAQREEALWRTFFLSTLLLKKGLGIPHTLSTALPSPCQDQLYLVVSHSQ